MSQAIQGPVLVPSPYQWNPQQQVSAALAPASSSMGNGDAIVLGGVIATTLLFGVGGLVAWTQLGTSSAKKSPISQVPPTPVEKAPTPQPTRESQYITLPGFPGFIDPSDGVYRERQIGGLCGMHAYNTVRFAFGMKPLTQEKFEEEVPGPGTRPIDLSDLAHRDGLDARIHFPEEFGAAGIGNTRAFIIFFKPPSPFKPHSVAMVRSEVKEGFHLSESGDQDKREIYPGHADKALHDYQIRSEFPIFAVIAFHKRVPVHWMVP